MERAEPATSRVSDVGGRPDMEVSERRGGAEERDRYRVEQHNLKIMLPVHSTNVYQ